MLNVDDLFKGRHFDREIIVLCVRWYLRYKLSSSPTLAVQDYLMRRQDSLMPNLQIRNAAIYCTSVVQGTVFVGQP
jgi:hypothetical protein